MQITLTITDGPNIDAETLRAFADKAEREGKTPEMKLAELITEASGCARIIIKPVRRSKAVASK